MSEIRYYSLPVLRAYQIIINKIFSQLRSLTETNPIMMNIAEKTTPNKLLCY